MAIAALGLGAVTAAAGTADVTLDCHALDTPGYAAAENVSTDVGSGTETDSQSFVFGYEDDEEIWCQWAVAYDYDFNAESPPTIRVFGYSKDCLVCVPGLTCDQTRYVDFEVSSRVYGHGDTLNASWGTADSALLTWSSTSCGSPCSANCWQSNVLKTNYADATPDAGDWDGDHVAYIRLVRDTGVTRNLSSSFVLTGVRLQYTTR
jgi:hypothetical protein